MHTEKTQSTTTQPTRTWFYVFFVLVTGGSIMMLEFAASRVMAPWFGTSHFVWGNVIGVVLIALSLGYYVGGRLADKYPNPNVLFSVVLGAGVFSAIIPIVVDLLTRNLNIIDYFYASSAGEASSIIGIILGSFVMIVLLMAIPIFLLGMVSPYVIRLATTEVSETGSVAGKLYAASTVGSIIGTFSSSFFLIPYVGSRETMLISAAALIAVAVIGKLLYIKRWWLSVAWIVLPLLVYVGLSGSLLRGGDNVVYEGETQYQFVQVQDLGDRLALIYNEGLGTQSYYMKSGVLTGAYYDYIGTLPSTIDTPEHEQHMLILGLAGGSLSRQWAQFYPESQVTGVEIDPVIIDIAHEYFAMGEQDNLTPIVADARPFLRNAANNEEEYSLVVIDAYADEFHIPWHLVTDEFFAELRSVTQANGMVAMNVGIAETEGPLFQSILKTAQQHFSYITVTHIPQSSNYMVTLSNEAVDFAALDALKNDASGRGDIAEYIQRKAVAVDEGMISAQALVLNDNRSPVEILTELSLLQVIFL